MKYQTQFLPGSCRVDTAIWMHYLDANKTAGEKARRQLHKNAASNIEQVLEATPHKVPTIRPSRKLSKLDELDMQETAGEAGTRSKLMYSYGPTHMAEQKRDDQLEHTYSSYVRIRDVALKTCDRWWTIGRSGERGSGISVLVARHDDDGRFRKNLPRFHFPGSSRFWLKKSWTKTTFYWWKYHQKISALKLFF